MLPKSPWKYVFSHGKRNLESLGAKPYDMKKYIYNNLFVTVNKEIARWQVRLNEGNQK